VLLLAEKQLNRHEVSHLSITQSPLLDLDRDLKGNCVVLGPQRRDAEAGEKALPTLQVGLEVHKVDILSSRCVEGVLGVGGLAEEGVTQANLTEV
jgi:hypothetical protein